jgi:hypothetical protein
VPVSNCKEVTICAVPFEMSIVDGGVLFSEKSGFYGVTARYMFSYTGHWRLIEVTRTFEGVPVMHFLKMYELLKEHIGDNFELKMNEPLRWRKNHDQPNQQQCQL